MDRPPRAGASATGRSRPVQVAVVLIVPMVPDVSLPGQAVTALAHPGIEPRQERRAPEPPGTGPPPRARRAELPAVERLALASVAISPAIVHRAWPPGWIARPARQGPSWRKRENPGAVSHPGAPRGPS